MITGCKNLGEKKGLFALETNKITLEIKVSLLAIKTGRLEQPSGRNDNEQDPSHLPVTAQEVYGESIQWSAHDRRDCIW